MTDGERTGHAAWWYLDAFYDLSTCRPVGGMGFPGPIPWTAARAYFRSTRLPTVEWPIFWKLLAELDAEFLDWCEKKAAEQRALSEPKTPSGNGRTPGRLRGPR